MKDPRKKRQEDGKQVVEMPERNPSAAGAGKGGLDLAAGANNRHAEVKRKILVVGKNHGFSPEVMEYAGNLAERLGYDIIAMNVHPGLAPASAIFSPYNQHLRTKFTQRARAAWADLAPELQRQGIHGEQVIKFAEVAQAVKDLNHEIKRIDFVITDQGIVDQDITGEIPLPVFSISGYQGEQMMASEHHGSKGKEILKMAALGLGTAALYAAVFLNAGTVMKYFTRGGWYAALPIATVFVFSFVHGAFAHHVWSLLGIEAVKKVQPRVAPTKRPAQRKRPRPRLRLNA